MRFTQQFLIIMIVNLIVAIGQVSRPNEGEDVDVLEVLAQEDGEHLVAERAIALKLGLVSEADARRGNEHVHDEEQGVDKLRQNSSLFLFNFVLVKLLQDLTTLELFFERMSPNLGIRLDEWLDVEIEEV